MLCKRQRLLDFIGVVVIKEFKTIDELVELLKARNVETDDETSRILQRESYYAIVNGYKGPFLDKDAMQSSASDIYRKGTTFRQMFDLFLYDRELRFATLPFLIRVESILKNATVYAFCEKNRAADAYLERSNYTTAKDMLVPKTYVGNRNEEYGINMANLMRILNGKLTVGKRTRPFIKHYIENYGSVPLWVLQNDLTFGNMAHFYQLQKRNVQNEASKIVGGISGRSERLTPHDLLRFFDVFVGFRNICAHDERLYCAEVKGARYADMLFLMAKILPSDEINQLASLLNTAALSFGDKLDQKVLVQVNSEMHIETVNGNTRGRGV